MQILCGKLRINADYKGTILYKWWFSLLTTLGFDDDFPFGDSPIWVQVALGPGTFHFITGLDQRTLSSMADPGLPTPFSDDGMLGACPWVVYL